MIKARTYNNAPFLQASTFLPQDPTQMRIKLTSTLNDIAYKVNKRAIASYDPIELVTGEDWFSIGARERRQTFRKVIQFPNVAGTATTSVAHGLGSLTNFTFTHIYGTLNLPGTPLFAPIPQGTPDDVAVTIDATNVNITTATGAYNGAYGLVILEYLKN